MGCDARKPVFGGLRSLISAFVISLLESIISRLPTSNISIFYLVSITEHTRLNRGLNLTLSEIPGRFSREEAHISGTTMNLLQFWILKYDKEMCLNS